MALCMPVPEDKNPHEILPLQKGPKTAPDLPPAKGAKNLTGS